MSSSDLAAFVISKTAIGLSLRTVEWYARFVTQYAAWARRCDAPIEKPETVEAYLAHLRTDGRSAYTVSGCYCSLSVFFKWMVERRGLSNSPMDVIQRPQTPIKRVRFVTATHFKALYDSIPGHHWWEERDRAILLILFYCGLRASELIGLRLDGVDRERLMLLVDAGKGDKDRDVPCTVEVITQTDLYLSLRPAYPGNKLFIARDKGSYAPRGPLAHDGLKEMLRRRCKAAGLPQFSAHKFRHGYAMAFANASMPLSALAATMGHSSVAVTERFYARWQTQHLSNVYQEAASKLTSR